MFLALLFGSLIYGGTTCHHQKQKEKEGLKRAMDAGMCIRSNGKISYPDGTVKYIKKNQK